VDEIGRTGVLSLFGGVVSGNLRCFGQVVELNRDSSATGGDGAKVETVSVESVFGMNEVTVTVAALS